MGLHPPCWSSQVPPQESRQIFSQTPGRVFPWWTWGKHILIKNILNVLLQYALKMVDEIREEEKMKQVMSKAAAADKEDAKREDKIEDKSADKREDKSEVKSADKSEDTTEKE